MTMPPKKTLAERLFQATLLEILAVVLCTPLFGWIMHTPLEKMGTLAVLNSTISWLWIAVFNYGTDRLRARLGVKAGVAWRSAHAVGYEATLFLFTVPLAMWWLDIGLHRAVMLDIGLMLFFIPVTYLFHWSYDNARDLLDRPCAPGVADDGAQ